MPVGAAPNGVATAEEDAVERPVSASAPIRQPSPAAMPRVARRATPAPQVRRGFAESAADYRYVTGDLRRIGILAAGLVVLLVVLSFVVPMVIH